MGKKKSASTAAAAEAVQPDTVNAESILSIEGSGAGDNKAAANMDKVFGSTDLQLQSKNGSTTVSALAGKEVVGLYFSAHWYESHLDRERICTFVCACQRGLRALLSASPVL